jgi:type IX secretion system PorP/SprF family membrane protein
MRILLTLTVTVLFFYFNLQAQYHSMFWNSYSLINPAASGVQYKYYGALAGRAKWLGYKDTPRTGSALFDVKLNPMHGGAGINYTYEKYGLTKFHKFNTNYSYHLNLPNEQTLSLGLSGGITVEKTDISEFVLPPDLDQLIIPEEDT